MRFSLLIVLLAGIFFSCDWVKNNGPESDKDQIVLGLVPNWPEGEALTALATEVLTQEGYKVQIQEMSIDSVFSSLDTGTIDIFMNVWSKTHESKLVGYDNLVKLGENYVNAKVGLVVPSYVSIDSIQELVSNASSFNHQIIGIEKQAGITQFTKQAIGAYNLNYELIDSSSVYMLDKLENSIKDKQWIVVTGWFPHWKFGRYNLKFLEDPKGVYSEVESIQTYAKKDFKQENEQMANFFSSLKFNDGMMANLLNEMKESSNKEAVAEHWIAENRYLIDVWLGKEQ